MRTDIHKPSSIIPADYSFVAFEYLPSESLGDCFAIMESRDIIRRHMASTGGKYSNHEHGGNCHICGAHCLYTALFYHHSTNVYIRTGLDCAEKLDLAIDGNPNAFKTSIKSALDRKAGKAKAQALLASSGLESAWNIYATGYDENAKYEEATIRDIVGNIVRYGSATEKQEAFLRSLVERIAKRPEIEAQRKAEHDAAKPIPITSERITVTGKILSFKGVETVYGYQVKMLIQSIDGWKVYGSKPSALHDAEVGVTVQFDAKIEPSRDDTKFGFFNRPSKARILA